MKRFAVSVVGNKVMASGSTDMHVMLSIVVKDDPDAAKGAAFTAYSKDNNGFGVISIMAVEIPPEPDAPSIPGFHA